MESYNHDLSRQYVETGTGRGPERGQKRLKTTTEPRRRRLEATKYYRSN